MKYFVLTCFWIYVWVSNVTATKYEAYRKEPHDTYCRALVDCDMILRNIVLTTGDAVVEKIHRTNMCTLKRILVYPGNRSDAHAQKNPEMYCADIIPKQKWTILWNGLNVYVETTKQNSYMILMSKVVVWIIGRRCEMFSTASRVVRASTKRNEALMVTYLWRLRRCFAMK